MSRIYLLDAGLTVRPTDRRTSDPRLFGEITSGGYDNLIVFQRVTNITGERKGAPIAVPTDASDLPSFRIGSRHEATADQTNRFLGTYVVVGHSTPTASHGDVPARALALKVFK